MLLSQDRKSILISLTYSRRALELSEHTEVQISHPHSKFTIGIMAFTGLLITYVETLVTPALPILRSDFNTNYDNLSWIITAYILSGTASSALFGRLADIYGKKKIFVTLSFVYTIAISFGGFAQNLVEFIAIRAVQGLGMGMFPIAYAMLYDQVPKERLALAQGIVSSTFSAGAAIGLVGGAVITQDFGWQWAYHSAIPIAALQTVLSIIVLRDTSSRQDESVDYVGITLLVSGIISILLPLSQGIYWGWFSFTTLFMFGLGAILLLSFVLIEVRVREPFISIKLLKVRNILLSNFTSIFAMASMFFLFYTISPMLQDPSPAGFGTSIVESGLVTFPAAILNMAFAPVAAIITTNEGPKKAILIGSLILFISYLSLMFNRGSIIAILEDSTILGMGLSFIFVGVINMLLISLPGGRAGEATGMNTVFRNLGGIIAPSIGGVIETTYTTGVIVGIIPFSGSPLGFMPLSHGFPSYTAFTYIFAVGILFLAISLVLTSLMKNIKIDRGNRN